MPATAEAARLNDFYRAAQGRVAAESAGLLIVAARRVLDPRALDRTFPAFMAVAHPLVTGAHQEAARVGAGYYQTHRAVSGVRDPLERVVIAPPPALRRTTTSLLVTGPIALKKALGRGVEEDAALAIAESRMAGAMFRMVADGGRDTILQTALADPRAQRFQRVTDGSPCDFCAMLAGRSDYLTEESAAGAQYHDRCNCYAEAVYTTA